MKSPASPLTNNQLEILAALGWEFDAKTNGIHFMFALSADDGVGFDAQNIKGALYLWKYEYELNPQANTTTPLSEGLASFEELVRLSRELIDSGKGFNIFEENHCSAARF